MKFYTLFMITCFMSIISRMMMSADNKFVNANKKRTELFKINVHALPKNCHVQQTDNLTIYSLINPSAGQGWNLELFDINDHISGHYHKIQTQIMIVIEGKLELQVHDKKVELKTGQTYKIPKDFLHSLTPINGSSRCLFVDFPGFAYPEDVFYDKQFANSMSFVKDLHSSEISLDLSSPLSDVLLKNLQHTNSISEEYYYAKYNKAGYIAYDLIPGELTNEAWSIAILEIKDSPKHYHAFGKEIFVVTNGELDIEVEGNKYLLKSGDVIHVPHNKIHHLKSANAEPVQVICINFPAFDPNDMHIVS